MLEYRADVMIWLRVQEHSRMFLFSIYKVDGLLFVLTGLQRNILFQVKPICDNNLLLDRVAIYKHTHCTHEADINCYN